ncbi:MAG TPA: methyltransferase domain-containing protein [Acidimicrobiales bacterium]|nr:methyltransferase domain-containing protein [Acidimicrobiales bacterium]
MTGMAYVDSALAHMEEGGPPPFWRHFHWGLFPDPERADDSPERYFAAAEAMTDRIIAAGEVGDGARVLDVGCGFGGTLDHLRSRAPGCALAGINIDERQLRWARRLLGAEAGVAPPPFVAADGCRLPVAAGSLDHVLAVECVFHFPSRRAFFREAARVLRPGGTVALSDFLMAPGALARVATTMAESAGLGEGAWYGYVAKPLTAEGYERLARSAGFEVLVDDDVTRATLPTYPALRRLARGDDEPEGLDTTDGVEALARAGDLQYHVLAFRRR